MGPRSSLDERRELVRLIEAVRVGVPQVAAAAARIEGVQQGQVTGVLSAGVLSAGVLGPDRALVQRWLADVARVAVLVCDQPDVISKELGARLDTVSSGLGAHLRLG